MKHLFIVVLAAALASCASPSSTTTASAAATGSGSSFATAIIVPATNEGTGVRYEHEYIRSHYPRSRFISQALTSHRGKPYDIMTFATADGKKHTLYFDISRYFGRF